MDNEGIAIRLGIAGVVLLLCLSVSLTLYFDSISSMNTLKQELIQKGYACYTTNGVWQLKD